MKNNQIQGVKSKKFGPPLWQTMFMMAMGLPEKVDLKNKHHKLKVKHLKTFYSSLKYIAPCVHCKNFIRDYLEKKIPLDYSGMVPLMKSLYLWKCAVSKKLKLQGNKVKPNPPFPVILKRYLKYRANCSKSLGTCK